MKVTSLPIVKQLYHWYQVDQFKKANKNLNGWECYAKLMQIEESNRRFQLYLAILRLKVCLESGKTTPEKLQEQKELVLSYSLIQEYKFRKLKEWIENVEVDTKDLSMLDDAMNDLLR